MSAELHPGARFAALGDSFTAGTGCRRGESWADLVAAALGGGVEGGRRGSRYLNLAADGATSRDVLGQLARAERLRPQLASVICGANDVLSSTRPDLDRFPSRLAEILDRLGALDSEPVLLTATYPTAWGFLGLGPRTRRRVADGIEFVNETIRELARERSLICLEVAGHPGLDERENFAVDGLHPSPQGHRRAAAAILEELASRTEIEIPNQEEIAWSR